MIPPYVAGLDPDCRGALCIVRVADLAVVETVPVELPSRGRDIEAQRAARLRWLRARWARESAQYAVGLDGLPVAIEQALKGADAGNIRGMLWATAVLAGMQPMTAPVRGRVKWTTSRVSMPGVPDPARRAECEARETVARFMQPDPTWPDLKRVPAGTLQAACLARWLVLRERRR